MANCLDSILPPSHTFLEYHFYKGGLRTEAFSLAGSRPAWAPPEDWVGFHDEFALEGDDRVVEVVKFDTGNGPVAWMGVFEAAPDQVYGDRKNHTGIGVWLLGGYPKEPALIVDALKSLLDLARKDGGERLPVQAKAFLSDYLGNYVALYEALPQPFGGLCFSKNQVPSTLTRRIDLKDEKFEEQLDDLIHRLFFILPSESMENARALTLLTSKGKSPETPVIDNQRGRLISDILNQLPVALRDQSRLIATLEQELHNKSKAVESFDTQVDQLNIEVMTASKRANEAENRLRELQTILEEDDERRRFSVLQSGITEIGSNVTQIHAKLNTFRTEILNDFRREIKVAPAGQGGTSQFRAQHVNQEHIRSPERPKSSREIHLLVYIMIPVLLAIAALVYFLLFR